MSRIELKGRGFPIPTVALPDPNISTDVPPIAILLPPGDFLKADYVGLGYTHFEAVCIGAAGGRGGDLLTGRSSQWVYGGAGGGGGLHRVAGTLAELSDATPVVIGEVGADGLDTNGESMYLLAQSYGLPGENAPSENLAIVDTGARPLQRGGHTYINADGSMVSPYVMVRGDTGEVVPSTYEASGPAAKIPYVLYPNAAFGLAQAGSDGGYSSFGAFCQASGGKGGLPQPNWTVYNDLYGGISGRPGGDGGDGGVGGQIEAGGGAAGGWTEEGVSPGPGEPIALVSKPPKDGTWDGTVGEGGGGGRGGNTRVTTSQQGQQSTTTLSAQNGGQGSFNYGDTSVFGPRQMVSQSVIPGGGGGAKLSKLLVFGGRSPGASPDGAVWIRLTKIV